MTQSAQSMQKSAQEARALLAVGVQRPAFLAKLAAYGINPPDAEAADELARIGDMLLAAHYKLEASQRKTASQSLAQIRGNLAAELQQAGLTAPGANPAAHERSLEKYAESALTNQDVVNACEAWKSYASQFADA